MRRVSGISWALLLSFMMLTVVLGARQAWAGPSIGGWSQTYGGIYGDYAYALVQTADGGYALAGWTNSYGAGGWDSWLVKTDSAGNALWNRTYGGTNIDGANALVQTADGGYAIAGYRVFRCWKL